MGVAARPRLLSLERVVTSPDGRTWRVRRRWKLRRPQWRRPSFDLGPLDGLDLIGDFVDGPTGLVVSIVLAVGVFVTLALVIVFLLPLVLLVAEAVLIGVSVVVLGRSWIVEARTEGPPAETLRRECGGWIGSRRVVTELAARLERGEPAAVAISGVSRSRRG